MEETTEVRKPQNGIQRAINIIVSPTGAIESIKEKPNYMVPMVIIWVVTLIATFLMKDFKEQLTDIALAGQGMSADQAAASKEMMSGFVTAAMYIGIVLAPLGAIFKGGISQLFSLIFSGKGTFGTTVSLVLNAYIIQMLGTVISLPIILMTQNAGFSFSPALLLPITKYGTPFYATLSALNIFTIWYLVVSVIGIKKIHEVSTWKAAVIALAPFILMVAFTWIGVLSGAPTGL